MGQLFSYFTSNNQSNSIFSLPYQRDDKYVLRAPPVVRPDGNNTVTQSVFESRMKQVLCDWLIKEDFNWENVIFAGGLVTGILENHTSETDFQQLYGSSDIDLFVYAPTIELVTQKMQYIYDYIIERTQNTNTPMVAFMMNYNKKLINFVVAGHRPIQVIGLVEHETAMSVLDSFDLSHCQVGYDGQKLVYTNRFLNAIQTKTTEIVTSERPIHLFRLIKAYRKGFSVLNTETIKQTKLVNYIHRYKNDNNTDSALLNIRQWSNFMEIETELPNILKDSMVLHNLEKQFIPTADDFDSTFAKKLKDHFVYEGCINTHMTILFCPDSVQKGGIHGREIKYWMRERNVKSSAISGLQLSETQQHFP